MSETECTEFGCRLEQAKKRIAELEAKLATARARIAAAREAWNHYALCHDRYGDDDLKTGRAWDAVAKALGKDND